jgi:uncharacterized protein YukE
MNLGSKDLGIQNLDIGFSSAGLEDYIKRLKLDMVDGLADVLLDFTNVENAINAGWQGVSRDRFLVQMKLNAQKINTDVGSEFEDLQNRFSEIQASYYNQDYNMMAIGGEE